MRCSREGQPVPDLYCLALLHKEAEGVLVSSLGLQFLDHQTSVMLLGLPW